MSKQAKTQGETTHNKDDKHPYRKKVQITTTNEAFMKIPQQIPQGIRVVAPSTKKYVAIFPIRERRKKMKKS